MTAKGEAFLLSDDFAYWFKQPEESNFFIRELHYLIKQGYELLIIGDNQWLVKGSEKILLGQ
jgi:hypothetical protein